jgi:hypothetical protein
MPKFTITDQRSRLAVIDYLQKLPDNGKRLDVSITLHRQRRTLDANALYWAWLGCIASETGNSKEDIHDAFREMFLGYSEKAVLGVMQRQLTSTTALDTKQFSQYMTEVEAYAATELSICLPRPEDRFYEDFIKEYGRL